MFSVFLSVLLYVLFPINLICKYLFSSEGLTVTDWVAVFFLIPLIVTELIQYKLKKRDASRKN
jgi:uncharacterized membrane protein HdeD (DUF308 family)